MSHNTPNTFQDDINRLVNAFLNRVEQLKMRLIFGVQVIRGANGKELEFSVADGKLYYDGMDITTGGGSTKWGEGNYIAALDGVLYGETSLYPSGTSGTVDALGGINRLIGDAGYLWLGSGGASTSTDVNLELVADAGGSYLKVDNGFLNMNSNKITNLTTPTANGDAANKSYIDGLIAGLSYMTELADDTTPELSYNLNANSYDLLYCNLLKFYDATGNNVIGTGSSGQIMAVSGANGSLLGYGSGGTVYAVVQVSSTEVDISKKVDMNGNDITEVDEIQGTSSGNLVLTCDTSYAIVLQKSSL
jgi:hypothetical protein